MRRLIPTGAEMAIFATLAILCAAIVGTFQHDLSDLGFAALAGPVFLVAACMGLRRSPAWTMESSTADDDGGDNELD